MSINKLISIKHPITNAMDDLGIDHDKFIPLFTRWAYEAENEIGSTYQYVTKREVLSIDGCAACLPNDAEYLEIAILGDLGCDCSDLNSMLCNAGVNLPTTYGSSDNSFLVVDIGDASAGGSLRSLVNYSIQNNKIIFEQSFDGQSVTIQYLAPQTDCDGFFDVGQNHKLAIQWYIIWKYYFRKNGKNSLEYGQMNKAEAEWHRECSHARAQDAMLTPTQRATIVGMYHNPWIGIGISDTSYTILGNRFSA